MLKNTFIHIPRVGEKTERKLWEQNYTDWDTIITSQTVDALGPSTAARVKEFAEKSKRALTRNDGAYFQALLNSQHTWRGYKEFAANTAYVDIETTGLSKYTSVVTMPNTEPAIDHAGLIRYVVDRGREAGHCRVFPTGAISPGRRG